MANNPVQIVLNSNNYIGEAEINPGGKVKDFYAGRNAEFVVHKNKLIDEISQIKDKIYAGDGVEFAKVSLQSKAWAKTRRPIERLFNSDKVPTVGGGQLGEFYVELTRPGVDHLLNTIEKAEAIPKKSIEDGEVIEKPTRLRGEVGAISSIKIHSAQDRRQFSIKKAIEWLANPRAGNSYIVELFITRNILDADIENRRGVASKVFDKFFTDLYKLKLPVEVVDLSVRWKKSNSILIGIDDTFIVSEDERLEIHRKLLQFLDLQSVVKSIDLPPVINVSSTIVNRIGEVDVEIIEPPVSGLDYPVVGIIDTGVESNTPIGPWLHGATDFLDDLKNQELDHGTFIAGLVAAGEMLNSGEYFTERPCKYFDLALHPTNDNDYLDNYPKGFKDFLDQLDSEISAAKEAGVRIFNMSLSVESMVSNHRYSEFAVLLDEIAEKHDVIFVIPSGNLEEPAYRPTWPSDPQSVFEMIAKYKFGGEDRLYQPAESIRAVTVGAIEMIDSINAGPSPYTRRGPGAGHGIKPDIAHVGGGTTPDRELNSIATDGEVVRSHGTSYASPLAAKTLAVLDHIIEGHVNRETLLALLVHNAKLPKLVEDKKLDSIVRDFVGFGVPKNAESCLTSGDHEISLVFTGAITAGNELSFKFRWPPSLVKNNGVCRGDVLLTLVYSPMTDSASSAEYVRINLEAYLRQSMVDIKTGELKNKGRLRHEGDKIYERDLILHGYKWWPIKRYSASFKRVGESSDWTLVVDSLTRAGVSMPKGGVPFTAILTISDPTGSAPVFNELRRDIQASGAKIADIKTAQRIRQV